MWCCYLIVFYSFKPQPSEQEDVSLKQPQDREEVLKILQVFDSNVWDLFLYDEEKVCKCGGHMHANLRWSQLMHVAL